MGQPAYQCFTWQGSRSDLSSTEARCKRTSDLPPVGVRDWPYKPDHLCKAIYGDSTNALAWLWQRMGDLAGYMDEHFPEHVPNITRHYQHAQQQQLHHRDMACEWSIDLPNGTSVFVAIVAVWDNDVPLLVHQPKGERYEAA